MRLLLKNRMQTGTMKWTTRTNGSNSFLNAVVSCSRRLISKPTMASTSLVSFRYISWTIISKSDWISPTTVTQVKKHYLNKKNKKIHVLFLNSFFLVFAKEMMDPESPLPFISGSDFGDEIFTLDQFHFHWGANTSLGSEHHIDGMMFPLEVYFSKLCVL